ncbi:MAG: hypothetical protein RML72_05845 [Bacteroidia bacterium]|nr:hypothetical protein [Bacteroidia bacterium]
MGIFFSACSQKNEEVIASYKGNALTRTQLNQNIPRGISSQDSAQWAQAYIQNWKIEQVLYDYAQKNVKDWEEKIQERIEDYKRKLLIYELQNQYLQQMDTTLTQKEVEAYYKANLEQYASTTTLYQFAYIRSATPQLANWIRIFPMQNKEELQKLEVWCKANADFFILDSRFQHQELIPGISAKAPFDIRNVGPGSAPKFWNSYENGITFYHLYYLIDVVRPGWPLPLSLIQDRVKESLQNKRKIEAIQKLESQLLQEANLNNEFQ